MRSGRGRRAQGRRRLAPPVRRKEHLVERRAAQGDVVDLDAATSTDAQRLASADRVPPSTPTRDPPRGLVDLGGAAAEPRQGRGDRRRARPGRARGPRSTSRPTRRLSSAGVPAGDRPPWSTITIWLARWSASSRYWVVSSTSVPSSTRVRMASHSSIRLRGSSPVVGSSSSSRRGAPTRLAPRSSRRRMPPE